MIQEKHKDCCNNYQSYEKELNDPASAYEAYRALVTQLPESRYSDSAIGQMEKLKKSMDKQAEADEVRKSQLLERLRILEVGKEKVGEVSHAEVPIPSA